MCFQFYEKKIQYYLTNLNWSIFYFRRNIAKRTFKIEYLGYANDYHLYKFNINFKIYIVFIIALIFQDIHIGKHILNLTYNLRIRTVKSFSENLGIYG